MKTGEGVLKSDKVDSEGGKNYWRQKMTLCNGKQIKPLKRYNNSKHVCRKTKSNKTGEAKTDGAGKRNRQIYNCNLRFE